MDTDNSVEITRVERENWSLFIPFQASLVEPVQRANIFFKYF